MAASDLSSSCESEHDQAYTLAARKCLRMLMIQLLYLCIVPSMELLNKAFLDLGEHKSSSKTAAAAECKVSHIDGRSGIQMLTKSQCNLISDLWVGR